MKMTVPSAIARRQGMAGGVLGDEVEAAVPVEVRAYGKCPGPRIAATHRRIEVGQLRIGVGKERRTEQHDQDIPRKVPERQTMMDVSHGSPGRRG